MTGMNVVGDFWKRKNVSASSSEISKGNEKTVLIYAIYRSFEGSGDKEEWKILMATVKGCP
jgi:hypothetical protein